MTNSASRAGRPRGRKRRCVEQLPLCSAAGCPHLVSKIEYENSTTAEDEMFCDTCLSLGAVVPVEPGGILEPGDPVLNRRFVSRWRYGYDQHGMRLPRLHDQLSVPVPTCSDIGSFDFELIISPSQMLDIVNAQPYNAISEWASQMRTVNRQLVNFRRWTVTSITIDDPLHIRLSVRLLRDEVAPCTGKRLAGSRLVCQFWFYCCACRRGLCYQCAYWCQMERHELVSHYTLFACTGRSRAVSRPSGDLRDVVVVVKRDEVGPGGGCEGGGGGGGGGDDEDTVEESTDVYFAWHPSDRGGQ